MNREKNEDNYNLQTLQRAVKILRAFKRDKKQMSLTELHKVTGIGKSSLQRLLFTLTKEGLLQKNEIDRSYYLGLDFIFFAELVEKNSNLITISKPIMERLNYETIESINLSVVENNMRKCIYNIESKHELAALTYVGHSSPLYAGASAKVLLAHFTDLELENYFSETELVQITDNTITDKNTLIKDLQSIREKGYALSNGERVKGAVSISAPIFDPFSKVFASLTILIPSARMDEDLLGTYIQKVVQGAKEVTEKIKLNN